MTKLSTHVQRCAVEVINALLNHAWFFRMVGFVNRRTGKIKSVFLVYPATRSIAQATAYPRRLVKNRWAPWPIGLLWQDGHLLLMVAISATDEEIRKPGAVENLKELIAAVERIRVQIGAERKTFAGVLPGVMARHKILDAPPEREMTARIVHEAVAELAAPDGSVRMPVIVLGGGGFIGSRLVELLDERFETYSVDVVASRDSWPDHLRGRPALLVNVANRGALHKVRDSLWPGMTVLNEVYPDPPRRLVEHLTEHQIAVHHVVGIRGGSIPRLPGAYRGAIPCCAAWPSGRSDVVVKALNLVPAMVPQSLPVEVGERAA